MTTQPSASNNPEPSIDITSFSFISHKDPRVSVTLRKLEDGKSSLDLVLPEGITVSRDLGSGTPETFQLCRPYPIEVDGMVAVLEAIGDSDSADFTPLNCATQAGVPQAALSDRATTAFHEWEKDLEPRHSKKGITTGKKDNLYYPRTRQLLEDDVVGIRARALKLGEMLVLPSNYDQVTVTAGHHMLRLQRQQSVRQNASLLSAGLGMRPRAWNGSNCASVEDGSDTAEEEELEATRTTKPEIHRSSSHSFIFGGLHSLPLQPIEQFVPKLNVKCDPSGTALIEVDTSRLTAEGRHAIDKATVEAACSDMFFNLQSGHKWTMEELSLVKKGDEKGIAQLQQRWTDVFVQSETGKRVCSSWQPSSVIRPRVPPFNTAFSIPNYWLETPKSEEELQVPIEEVILSTTDTHFFIRSGWRSIKVLRDVGVQVNEFLKNSEMLKSAQSRGLLPPGYFVKLKRTAADLTLDCIHDMEDRYVDPPTDDGTTGDRTKRKKACDNMVWGARFECESYTHSTAPPPAQRVTEAMKLDETSSGLRLTVNMSGSVPRSQDPERLWEAVKLDGKLEARVPFFSR